MKDSRRGDYCVAGRVRHPDDQLTREVLVEESMIAALPAHHPLAQSDEPVALAALARETLVVYPHHPRPSFADQQIGAFRDHALEPHAMHEVKELQTALGLITAEMGMSLVPRSVAGLRAQRVVYRPLRDGHVASPVIMSPRARDRSMAHDLFNRDRRFF
jgi:LysR family transcriptional regulator, benzoate and cis,cis-muconate-responsive activator of ben and cat genes